MASAKTVALIERLAWIYIYLGMFTVVLGIVSGGVHVVAGWSLGVLGAIVTVAGIVLIVVRARVSETPPPGAQSSSPSQGDK
jgi:hypothetical protein